MKTTKMTIWGREFELKIVFDCYSGEKETEIQQQALTHFLEKSSIIDGSLQSIWGYCKNLDSTIQADNIFKYVIPQALFIQRTRDNSRVVAIMGAFKLDLEHGIAIVFKNETFWKIGGQDIIL